MKKINYQEILQSAWKIVWQNKYLWWFGLMASLSGGCMFFSRIGGQQEKDWRQFMDFWTIHREFTIIFLLGSLLVGIIFWLVGIVGQGALIKAVQQTLTKHPTGFKEGLKAGKKYFGKIFLISLITFIFMLAAVLILVLPIIFFSVGKSSVLGGVLVLVASIILIPNIFVITFTRKFAYLYAVLADLSLNDSLENGYGLILKNIWPLIAMTAILTGISLLFLIVLAIVLAFLIALFIALGGFLFLNLKIVGLIGVIILALVVLLGGPLFCNALLKTFIETVWILFFVEIAKPQEPEIVPAREVEIKAEVSGMVA
jgi:hypothetical protein